LFQLCRLYLLVCRVLWQRLDLPCVVVWLRPLSLPGWVFFISSGYACPCLIQISSSEIYLDTYTVYALN
jgi:hypothetical protein